MAIPIVEFSREGYKIRKVIWLKINCSEMKLANFENWSSGNCQKLGIVLENKVIQKYYQKNVNNKKCAPKFVSFNEKKSERIG